MTKKFACDLIKFHILAKIIGFSTLTMITFADSTEQNPDSSEELFSMSIEQIMDLTITSVSKKEESLSEAAAAVFVVTSEDIRRSGVTSIPEALRLVPGLQVAQITGSSWAIGSRGSTGFFALANKLLVLIDGRTVYTPTLSGVHWDVQDTLLSNIDRIEVIRGPGATLWGANAVNGVINIITKDAQQTQGVLITGGGGYEEALFQGFRIGKRLTKDIYYRIYTKAFKRDDLVDSKGDDLGDDWEGIMGGFRLDWQISNSDKLTIQGDLYDEKAYENVGILQSLEAPSSSTEVGIKDLKGANVLGRWTHSFSESSSLVLQLYYDRLDRNISLFEETYDTVDIDLQHQIKIRQHELVWGGRYRYIDDNFDNSFTASLNPRSRDTKLYSGFVQDSVNFFDGGLRLTLGSKFEHNDSTGFEIQPTLRAVIKSGEGQTFWGAISRAVRTPSRSEDDGQFSINIQPIPHNPLDPLSPRAIVTSLISDEDFESEELLAYEMGYRIQPFSNLFLDLATFYNEYENLRTFELQNQRIEFSPQPTHIVVPFTVDNKMDGETYGIELSANWDLTDYFRIAASYTFLQMQLHLDNSSTDPFEEEEERQSPHNQFQLRSYLDLPRGFELDSALFYVDNLTDFDIPSFFRFDIRLGWQVNPFFEISLVAQNLFDSQHPEFQDIMNSQNNAEVERSIFGKVTVNF